MSAVEYKTEQEIQKMGIDILYKGLGATDFIRFMQQFDQGHGNYVEDRLEWQQNYSVNDILAEIESSK
ncbi:MAG: hypothetical protein WAW41_03800 [Methylobacter sp.]